MSAVLTEPDPRRSSLVRQRLDIIEGARAARAGDDREQIIKRIQSLRAGAERHMVDGSGMLNEAARLEALLGQYVR